MKKQVWYGLVYWTKDKSKKELVGYKKTTLYKNKLDAKKDFNHYPKEQNTRGESEHWEVIKILA